MTLRCSPMPGHLSVSWYQQVLGQGLRFLFEYYNKQQREKGNLSDRFSAQQFQDSSSELSVSSLELTDSALYLCASSMTQLCATSSLLHRNTPVPLRTGATRAAAAPGKADRPSPDPCSAACLCDHLRHAREGLFYGLVCVSGSSLSESHISRLAEQGTRLSSVSQHLYVAPRQLSLHLASLSRSR